MPHATNSIQCDKCERTFHPNDIDNHKALHEQKGDICLICGLGMMVESEDKTRITCTECSTTWVKKGHEKPVSEKI